MLAVEKAHCSAIGLIPEDNKDANGKNASHRPSQKRERVNYSPDSTVSGCQGYQWRSIVGF